METLIIGVVALVILASVLLVSRKKKENPVVDKPIGNTPIKDRTSYPFDVSPDFGGVLHNAKAEVDTDGKYYLSFGQANPAKGITVKGKEWGGKFNVYVAENRNLLELVTNQVKEDTDYLWKESGSLGFKPTGNIGFIILKA